MLNFNDLEINNNEPIYIQICKHTKRQIFQKSGVDGDVFPSRRELAAKLGINPNTIQKAYKHLEDEGILYTKSNTVSSLIIDERLYTRISAEFKIEFIGNVIKEAKLCNLSFKQVIDMLSEQWEEQE